MFADILRRREVSSVVWFHTDHWEPWGHGIDEKSMRRVDSFAKQAERSSFARKMTLFYPPDVPYGLKGETADTEAVSVPGDCIEFRRRTAAELDQIRSAVAEVRARTATEFQVHLHHEFITRNDGHWNETHSQVMASSDAALDEQRLRLLLRLTLEAIGEHTGERLDRWAFIHGCWALNGSDSTVCQVANEIQLLMDFGGWGDFTFPAGRPHCDPFTIQQPYTVMPITAMKGYDRPEAEPIRIDVGAGAINRNRFLIWNSAAKSDACSLDVYSPADRTRIGYCDRVMGAWLSECPVIDGVLYIKTHAHSMNLAYHEPGATIPLGYPGVVALFDLLESTCDKAGVELRRSTVGEVYGELKAVDGARERTPRVAASASASLRDEAASIEIPLLAEAAGWKETGSPAWTAIGEYYRSRFATGRFFEDHDLYTAEYCVRTFGPEAMVVEVGSGLGELSFLIAARGRRVIGLEPNIARYEASRALHQKFLTAPTKSADMTLKALSYPAALAKEGVPADTAAVLVCTHLTGSDFLGNMENVIQSLPRFEHLVIDVSTFGKRRDEDAVASLVSSIVARGFKEVRRVYQDQSTDVRHFERA